MRLILWFAALLLCLFHLSMAVGYTGLLAYAGSGITLVAICFWILVLACGLYLIIGIIKPAFRKSRRFMVYNFAVLVPMSVVLVWLLVDGKPLTNDYTAADHRTKTNGSYPYLGLFNQDNRKELEQIHADLEDSDGIETAWRRIVTYRRAVDALNRFDSLCDLPPDAAMDMNMPFLNFQALRNTADIYYRYLEYKVENGQAMAAVEDVSHLYGFTRKGLSHASILINKIMFLALADKGLNKVFEVINHRRCDPETVETFRRVYTPLNPDEFSLTRAFIGEYIFLKTTMRQQVKPDTFLETLQMPTANSIPERPAFPMASRFAYYVGFKPNASLGDIKKLFDLIIEAQKSTPPDYTAVNRYTEQYRRQPQLRNMAGWILNTIAMPDFAAYSNRGVQTKIRSDLLAIALYKKTGASLDIKDYFTKGPYRYREEPGALRHPGQDGQYNTDDDIILGAQPKKA